MRVTDGERVAQVSLCPRDEFPAATARPRHNMGMLTREGQFGAADRATT
jgi:hypothetical protein